MKIINNNLTEKDIERLEELAINIDMVNGFVKQGALAAPSIMRVVPRQQELLDEYLKEQNKGIMFIQDTHNNDSVEFKTFGPHCIEGSGEEDVIDELQAYYDYSLNVKKNSTNFVFGTNFQEQIDKLKNLRKVLLMGCLSEVCVKNRGITLRNYFDQFNRDIDIYVAADAIDTYDAPGHNAEEVTAQAINDMSANGIKVYRR
jgi:nicotinamidase-related amidase